MKEVFHPINTNLFGLQITWSDLKPYFKKMYFSATGLISQKTHFWNKFCALKKILTSIYILCCICSLCLRIMDMSIMLQHSWAPCLAAGRICCAIWLCRTSFTKMCAQVFNPIKPHPLILLISVPSTG